VHPQPLRPNDRAFCDPQWQLYLASLKRSAPGWQLSETSP
jgi:hypothetical protein